MNWRWTPHLLYVNGLLLIVINFANWLNDLLPPDRQFMVHHDLPWGLGILGLLSLVVAQLVFHVRKQTAWKPTKRGYYLYLPGDDEENR